MNLTTIRHDGPTVASVDLTAVDGLRTWVADRRGSRAILGLLTVGGHGHTHLRWDRLADATELHRLVADAIDGICLRDATTVLTVAPDAILSAAMVGRGSRYLVFVDYGHPDAPARAILEYDTEVEARAVMQHVEGEP